MDDDRSESEPRVDANDDDSDDGPGGAAAAASRVAKDGNRKGVFEFPERPVDLIGLFLDADIRAARDKIHLQIENGALPTGAGVEARGGVVNNQGLTKGAKAVSKAVVNIHALQKQANRNMRQKDK